MKIVVASKNPVKINAVSTGFKEMFPDEVFEVLDAPSESGVPDQPQGYAQTFQGAKNRVDSIIKSNPDCDLYVGIEGGIENSDLGTEVFAWVYIKDKSGMTGIGKTGSLYLPVSITKLLKEGLELGDASDKIFNEKNSKQNNGTVGILTGNAIDRTAFYVEAVIYALIPFKNKSLYAVNETAPTP